MSDLELLLAVMTRIVAIGEQGLILASQQRTDDEILCLYEGLRDVLVMLEEHIRTYPEEGRANSQGPA